MPVLKACVENGVNTCTSSYVSPDMLKLHDEAKAKGLTLLNECGLDPGIDIMGTMKVVNEAKQRGWKVVSYESFCGGLPVAEQADNPLGYKFSWNPGAAIKASRNQAIFFKNGKRVVTDSPLKCVEDRDGYSAAMKFEVYPNRDSTVFMERFGMMDCETFIRGTIRFKGFSGVSSRFVYLCVLGHFRFPRSWTHIGRPCRLICQNFERFDRLAHVQMPRKQSG